MQHVGYGKEPVKIDPDLLRHMILNSLRSYNVKFKAEYGEMIIACDGRRYWRKDINPYYKANRSKSREESVIDWEVVFQSLDAVREELVEYFPYRVIRFEDTEADDIIGTLCKEYGNTFNKILIISADKDFRQLQGYMNVFQYDPIQKKMIVENNPTKYLKEHIMRGDSGDGVTNYLSPSNSLVLKIRQKPISQKKMEIWLEQEPEEFCDAEQLRRYRENELQIDLDKIPESIHNKIVEEFDRQANKTRSKLFNYFIKFKLKNLLTDIEQF